MEAEETLPLDEANDEVSSTADVCDPEKYQEVFRSKHRLSKMSIEFLMRRFNHCMLFTKCTLEMAI